jgi:antitoxin HicB
MRYPVNLQPDTGGFFVSFPDIPEALTQGDDRENALFMGLDALITAFDFYFEDSRPVPPPSAITGDYVDVPLSVASKVMLLNSFLEQEVTRLFDLHHSTKIDTIQRAMSALGKRLELQAA